MVTFAGVLPGVVPGTFAEGLVAATEFVAADGVGVAAGVGGVVDVAVAAGRAEVPVLGVVAADVAGRAAGALVAVAPLGVVAAELAA